MNSNQLKLILLHKKKMEQSMNILLALTSSQASIRRRKRLYILQIMKLWQKRKALISAMEKGKIPRSMRTKKRTSTFWEREVLEKNDDYFKQHFRMTRKTFNILCRELNDPEMQDTNYKFECIPFEKRIAIALFTLGSSAEYSTVSAIFGVEISTVCTIVKTFCEQVWNVLKPKYLCAYPLNEDIIKENVNGFEKLGFPQCFGAVDCCHIEIKPPVEDAMDYYNYKGWYSTVLLAVVDYRSRFLYISVGSPGRCKDSQIYEDSYVRQQHRQPILQEMSKKIGGVSVPAVLIGDSAFRFSESLMKPFPLDTDASLGKKNFNYALSKCHRTVVENSFGHLKARFKRIGESALDNRIGSSNLIIKACCVLHNFLNNHKDEVDIEWLEYMKNSTQREQPEQSTQIDDYSVTPSIIRNAISVHLAEPVIDVEASESEMSVPS